MSISKDYLEREIQKLGSFLQKITDMVIGRKQKPEEIHAEIDKILKETFTLNLEEQKGKDSAAFLETVLALTHASQTEVLFVCRMLKEKAEISQDASEKKEYYNRSLCLLEWVCSNAVVYSMEWDSLKSELKRKISEA